MARRCSGLDAGPSPFDCPAHQFATFYRLTKAGRQQLDRETGEWRKTSIAIASALQPT